MEEKRIEAFEQRKNREQSKKFNKQLSLIKKTEKTKETRNFNKEIEHVKKSKDGNKDEKLERILNSDRHGDRDRTEKSKKRKIMDKKYGFGGKDGKKSKMNDSKSLNDFTDFNPRGGKAVRSSVPRRTKGGKGANRPGKAARAKSRGGKR
jgi:rRNA-processing protein EBP2